jgi:L-threonylcarbamoyladenylate synthase
MYSSKGGGNSKMTRRQTIDAKNPDPEIIAEVARLIQHGCLVVVPTDTAYGLAGDPSNTKVVQRVLAAKHRDGKLGMPLLVSSFTQAQLLGRFSPLAETLATQFWPGALTLIVPAHHTYPVGILGPQNSLALRVPNHPVTLQIIDILKAPIIGTSANKPAGPSPRTAATADTQIGTVVDFILDAGPTPLTQDSTIVNCAITPPRILREGALPSASLRPWLNPTNSE